MAKKDLSSLVSGIMGTDRKIVSNPETVENSSVKTSYNKKSQADSEYDTVVTSFRIKKNILKKLKIIAATEEIPLQKITQAAFKAYISKWESENK